MEQQNQLKATWTDTIKVWWWLTWRSVLCAFAGGFIIGFLIYFILKAFNAGESLIQNITGVISGIFGLLVNLFFLRKVLNKKFRSFSVSLTKNSA